MTKKNDGGPAFPTPSGFAQVQDYQPGVGEYLHTVEVCQTGMSLRDVFAAVALHGLCESPTWLSGPCDRATITKAWRMADMMIEER